MKLGLWVRVLVVITTVTLPFTAGQSREFVKGIIVKVEKQNVATPPVRTGAEAVRAPLQWQYYLYNVSVQLNCDVYVGRYESEFNDLPAALSTNNRVQVRLKKHTMYLDFPGDTVKMQIVHHSVSHEGTCEQTGLAK